MRASQSQQGINSNSVESNVKWNEREALEVVIFFGVGYVYIWMGSQQDDSWTNIHVLYTEVVSFVMSIDCSGGLSADDVHRMMSSVREFKTFV